MPFEDTKTPYNSVS